MTRIAAKFNELKKQKKKAFVSYIMAGDPNKSLTAKLLLELPKAGVDLIELGIPFSDPMAEGPTIQRAAERSLKNNCNLNDCFELVKKFRLLDQKTPIILMGYYNSIFVYSVEKFLKTCQIIGVDGMIIVDLPPEEENEVTKKIKNYQIDLIRLTTPTTDAARAKTIFKNASGFIYYISVAGVTGVKQAVKAEVQKSVKALKQQTKLPVCVGFGISNAQTAKEIAETNCDGIVIGSAFIKIIEENISNPVKAVANCISFAQQIRKAID
jgi:tryptophan synthase alpha chain